MYNCYDSCVKSFVRLESGRSSRVDAHRLAHRVVYWATAGGLCRRRVHMPRGERAHAVIDGPNGMAWNYAGSEGWAPCAGHSCGLARVTVRSSCAPVHLCPVQGHHRCVSEATVPEGRGASGDRRAKPGVTQSEPGGEEATGARERDRGGRRRGDPEAGPREKRA